MSDEMMMAQRTLHGFQDRVQLEPYEQSCYEELCLTMEEYYKYLREKIKTKRLEKKNDLLKKYGRKGYNEWGWLNSN